MKKLLQILFMITAISGLSVCAAPLKADISSEHIPAGTVIAVKTIDFVDSSKVQIGDRFNVMTIADIVAGEKMILPKGSVIRGSVQAVKPKKMVSRDAAVYVKFDHLVSPTGDQIPVVVGIHSTEILTKDGGLGYDGNYVTASKQNVDNAGKIIKNMTKWGITTGEKAWNGWPKYVITPFSSLLSVPTAGLYLIGDEVVDIFKKGNDIALNQGEVINLMFMEGVDVPTH
ncbi:MAG: hypothetical protein K6C94_01260 [Candidatus Gastranaerophilales bacterium]|nr:hypothetical protein [Candidatus Gastranaerophilales bacterium]